MSHSFLTHTHEFVVAGVPMNKISLGDVFLSHNRFNVTVCLDGDSFSHFLIAGSKGELAIEKWYFGDGENNDSLYPLIKEACSRFDALEELLRKSNKESLIDFSAYGQLARLGIDVSSLVKSNIEIRGNRHYEIINKSAKITNQDPPFRGDYSSHLSYRQAMDRYMERSAFLRQRAAQSHGLCAVEVAKPSSESIIAYNESIAIYKYQQRELDLLKTTK